MADIDIYENCLLRIKEKYARKGQSHLWTDNTRVEFIKAFSLVPVDVLNGIVDEMLLHPAKDEAGKPIHFVPDSEEIVAIAERMTGKNGDTASNYVAEIWNEIRRTGMYGTPRLSPGAMSIVEAMGGWKNLCCGEAPDSVVTGLMLKHAGDVAKTEKRKPLLTGTQEHRKGLESMSSIMPRMEASRNSGNGKAKVEK